MRELFLILLLLACPLGMALMMGLPGRLFGRRDKSPSAGSG